MTDKGFRRRLPLVALVAVCVTAVTVAVSGAADPTGGLRFAQSGHWISNAALGIVFHIDGAAKVVDNQVRIDGLDPNSQVVQGDTSGFVLGGSRITQFGKSNLSVEKSVAAPTGELPSLVEATGGPYVVYKEAGQIVRTGSEFETINAGGALGEPVATPDGTLWLHQRATGKLCELPKSASQVNCPITVPTGHDGALTVVGKQAVFVDTTADELRLISGDGLGEAVKINTDVSPAAKIALSAAEGRIAILEPAARRLVFVDASGLDTGRPSLAPVTISLADGSYAGPTASSSAVVLLDLTHNNVLTYGPDGTVREKTAIPAESGEPRLVRGDDDRVYVDGGEAKHVMVVDPAGAVTPVPVAGADKPPTPTTSPVQPTPVVPPVSQEPPVSQVPPKTEQPPAKPDVRKDNPPKQTSQPPVQKPQPPAQPPPVPSPPVQKPIPASPPGVAGNLKARLQGTSGQVTWGAAAANGAAITGYVVSWKPSSGTGSGSVTVAGGTLSRTIPALRAGITYTIIVMAQNSAGRGPAATTTVDGPALPKPKLVLSRGPSYNGDQNQCPSPNCAWMHIVLSGFTPGTMVNLKPYSTNPDYGNTGRGVLIEADGTASTDAFYYPGAGDKVYVATDDGSVRSNTITWSAG
ncbi:fibronectin type III domain-containing protein [Amycolatopsis sp. H20-H5]|uniref:fibronectin type III domain-containing protein n=1 Tax=Amycolatopsis sp. H20-H5 TaxID=3046309 RepID=UPI002DBEE65B|nr:fibronectin type III domain-containing protein [Amycolatopsis sp. H20-H5]MEC3978825.1 fibronectin type III domain-containing protein [Amycolatopsis sp. H20-H5]